MTLINNGTLGCDSSSEDELWEPNKCSYPQGLVSHNSGRILSYIVNLETLVFDAFRDREHLPWIERKCPLGLMIDRERSYSLLMPWCTENLGAISKCPRKEKCEWGATVTVLRFYFSIYSIYAQTYPSPTPLSVGHWVLWNLLYPKMFIIIFMIKTSPSAESLPFSYIMHYFSYTCDHDVQKVIVWWVLKRNAVFTREYILVSNRVIHRT